MVDRSDEVEDLATSLAHMARELLAHESVDSTLDGIVKHAAARVDRCDEASVMMLDSKRRLTTVAATSEVPRESDRIQAKLAEGPCFDAADQKQEVYRVADMSARGDRWPNYAPQARALGIGSMLAFLLFTTRESFGALNLYSAQPDAFTQRSETVGWILASHAAVALAGARNDAQLHEAISTRQGIGEAMGIVMAHYKLSEDRAFALLRRISQTKNLKLRDVAHEVVVKGEIPETDAE